jgi:hypothetical protein
MSPGRPCSPLPARSSCGPAAWEPMSPCGSVPYCPQGSRCLPTCAQPPKSRLGCALRNSPAQLWPHAPPPTSPPGFLRKSAAENSQKVPDVRSLREVTEPGSRNRKLGEGRKGVGLGQCHRGGILTQERFPSHDAALTVSEKCQLNRDAHTH